LRALVASAETAADYGRVAAYYRSEA